MPQARSAFTFFPEKTMHNQKIGKGMAIDFIFADKSFQIIDSHVISECAGSDHRPVMAVLAKNGSPSYIHPATLAESYEAVFDSVHQDLPDFQKLLSKLCFDEPIANAELEIEYDTDLTLELESEGEGFYTRLFKMSSHQDFKETRFFKRHCRVTGPVPSSIFIKVFFSSFEKTVMVDTGCSLPLIDRSFLLDHYPKAEPIQLAVPVPLIIGDGTSLMRCTHRVTI